MNHVFHDSRNVVHYALKQMNVMKIIAFVSQENNTGKTTLAIHMAEMAVRAGKSVTLIDTDTQGGTTKWFRRRRQRDNDNLATVTAHPKTLPDLLIQSKQRKVDLVIIDTHGNSSKTANIASQVADLTYFPCRSGLLTPDRKSKTPLLSKSQKAPVFILLNFCRQSELAGITRMQMQRNAYPVLDFGISDCVAFRTSVSDGRSVLEDDPAGQATIDIKNLFSFTRKRLRF